MKARDRIRMMATTTCSEVVEQAGLFAPLGLLESVDRLLAAGEVGYI